MAKYLETFVDGQERFIVACQKFGCSWAHYELVDAERASFLDTAHSVWHIDSDTAETERQRRRDGIR